MKKLIICLLVLITLIVANLILINKNENNNNIINTQVQQNKSPIKENNIVNPKEVKNPHMYMTVKSCIEKYINYIYSNDSVSVYRIIDNDYLNKFNLTEKNVLENVGKIENPTTVHIEEMYVNTEEGNEQEYYVSGTINEENINGDKIKETKFVITVKLDKDNMIYSVIP